MIVLHLNVSVKLCCRVLHQCIVLTHWGWVTYICVSKLTIIGSNNGLSPGWHRAIIWTNGGILLIWPSGTNFNEMVIEIHPVSFTKCIWKSCLWNDGHFCLSLNVLRRTWMWRVNKTPMKLNYSVPIFSPYFRIIKIWVTCWISSSYLTDVIAAMLG